MDEKQGENTEKCGSPSQIRREARSEGYLERLNEQSSGHLSRSREAMRVRSYSTSDSDDLEERLAERRGSRNGRGLSITEMLLGRRNVYRRSDSVPLSPDKVDEVSESMEEISKGANEMSTDNGSPVFDENGSKAMEQKGDSEESTVRQRSQTDHLNKHLLDAFLSRISNIAGIGNQATVYNDDNNGEEKSGEDYTTIYSDDLLMDRICRRVSGKKK